MRVERFGASLRYVWEVETGMTPTATIATEDADA